MGTSLASLTPASTYTALLKTTDNLSITNVLKTISDGSGNDTTLQLSTLRVGLLADTSVTTQTSAVIQATTTNSNLVLNPNGTGAIVASIPDGTATGGNARGANAVDLQTVRTASNQVAGPNSVIVGGNNNRNSTNGYEVIAGGKGNFTNNGYSGILTGQSNVADAGYSIVTGGNTNQIYSPGTYAFIGNGQNHYIDGGWGFIGSGNGNQVRANYGTISGGQSNTASTNTHATVVGGQGNTSSGQWSISGGNSNTSSGESTVALGRSNTATNSNAISIGFQNIVSGLRAVAIGYQNTSNSISSVALGYLNTAGSAGSLSICTQANTYLYSQFSKASGAFVNVGDAQQSFLTARKLDTLTTAATTVLSLDGTGTTNLIIPNGNNRAWNVTVKWVAVVTLITGTATGVTVGDTIAQVQTLGFKRVGGTSSLVGTANTLSTNSNTSMSTASMTYTAGASQELALTFTAPTFAGAGTITCRVVAKVELTECAW